MSERTKDQGRTEVSQGPTNPARVKGFVKYFNSYIASIVVAAIPAPVSQWSIMPILPDQRGILTVVTPIFCFLVLAFLFFVRDDLAGMMFPYHANRGPATSSASDRQSRVFTPTFWHHVWSLVPLLCIVTSLVCCAQYYGAYLAVSHGPTNDPAAVRLPLYYILSFVCAEAAFVWMALKEYIQDIIGISDHDLIASGMTAKPDPGGAPAPPAAKD